MTTEHTLQVKAEIHLREDMIMSVVLNMAPNLPTGIQIDVAFLHFHGRVSEVLKLFSLLPKNKIALMPTLERASGIFATGLDKVAL